MKKYGQIRKEYKDRKKGDKCTNNYVINKFSIEFSKENDTSNIIISSLCVLAYYIIDITH